MGVTENSPRQYVGSIPKTLKLWGSQENRFKSVTVFPQIFISLVSLVRRLFEGGVYSRAAFILLGNMTRVVYPGLAHSTQPKFCQQAYNIKKQLSTSGSYLPAPVFVTNATRDVLFSVMLQCKNAEKTDRFV